MKLFKKSTGNKKNQQEKNESVILQDKYMKHEHCRHLKVV
jgi:hypothetical protein